MNEKIITLNGTEYIVKTDNGQSLTPELLTNVKNQLMVRMGITSKSELNIVKLGTPTCPSSIPVNTVGTLTASVTQGTAPFTYTWTITKPGGGTDSLPNSAGPHSYTFSLTGQYGINLTVVDNCPTGGLSDTAFCSVTVTPIITTGSISFTTPSTPGASIFLDGPLVGITPATITGVSLYIAHPYILRLAGYNDATGSVTLTTSSPNQTVTATLTPTPSYANWVASKGGAAGLYHNLSAIGEIIDGYIGGASILGFTVTFGNVGTTINYYLGV